jgi:hypothetical protein
MQVCCGDSGEAGAKSPDCWLQLVVHGDVVVHGGVVGKREIENDLNTRSRAMEYSVAAWRTGRQHGLLHLTLTMVQLTPMKEEE